MKTILKTLLVCAAIFTSTISGFGQGSLTPPGAPAPTMKTLDQVKAGTPITSAPYTISSSGNYFLTGNLTVSSGDGIDVDTSGVTIDLNGFTIAGTGGGMGINIGSSTHDITILNGHITGGITYSGGNYTGSGFANGINYGGTGNVRVTGVTVSGVSANGIALNNGNSTVVDSCLVNTAGSYGIQADTVSHSTAYQCGNTAIFAQNTATDCFGFCTASGDGIFTWSNALNCTGGSGSGIGLSANNNAENCVGYSNGSGIGLNAGYNALNCYGISSVAGFGLSAGNNASNCYGNSTGSIGLAASGNALNCYGYSSSGPGMNAYIAIGCYGHSSSNTGLVATIANSCAGSGSPAYTVTNKYNMP